MRTCNICNKTKELHEFEKMPKKKFGRGYRCNECNRVRARNPEWERLVHRTCPVCNTEFSSGKLSKKFCSEECNSKADIARIQDNPRRYFQRALNPQRVKDGLTWQALMELLEKQGGKCALTGRTLTFDAGRGAVDTNCSLDRIHAGGPYTIENVQLVCAAINGFRRNLPMDVFIDWCNAVSTKAKGGRK